MERSLSATLLACALALSTVLRGTAAAETLGIPLKPDPPIAVDGDLGDWAGVPNAVDINRPEQAVWGAGAWQSPDDMSGTVHLAWRQEYLFIAASVVDDAVAQAQRGANLWKGDHVEIYIDAQPDLDPNRDTIGEGQFQIGLSPGNFLHTGDSFTDCPPEAFCFRPTGTSIEGIVVAAAPTPNGWTLEAAIPWAVLGVTPQEGTFLRIEVALSDTDAAEAGQETLLTTSSETWEQNRSRWAIAALAGSDGTAPERASRIAVFDELRLETGEKKAFTFEAPALPEGRRAVLSLQARLHSDQVAGFTQALRFTLNGQPVSGDRLLNKPLRVKSRGGQVYSMYAGDRLSTYYTPNFAAPDIHHFYGLMDGVKPCLFELDVTDLLKEGENALDVDHAADPAVKNPLFAEGAHLAFLLPPPPPKEKAGPPTGPLPVVEPRASTTTDFTVKELPDARLEIGVAGETFVVESRFSSPKPEWVHGTWDFFKHERRIEKRTEGVLVFDTFTNLTNENLGIMHRHEAALGDRLKGVWLAGLDQPGLSGKTATPANSTTYGCTDKAGIGFIAVDSVTRVHVANYAMEGTLGVADNNLVIPPGKSHTAEWIIVPTDEPGYWRFINTARRLMNANFLLDGMFAFLRQGPLTDPWSDQQVIDFLTFKDADYVCSSIGYPMFKGRYSHGTAFQQIDHDAYKKSFTRWRALYPDAKYIIYFHCFLDVTDDAPEQFPDARTLRADGGQADYGQPYDRLFFPTLDNSYGAAIARNVDIILDDIGADGVYWDEHEYSRSAYHFGEPWDGVSGDIDPNTMKITGLKSNITLISEAWRLKMAQYTMSRGPLIGNGAPQTPAMAALHFPCFVETGSINNCTKNHLYSPIALGDHLTERSEEDAYGTMLAALDYGCVYHWYNDLLVIPTHHTLTRYMYPITPMELHEGYIIGQERIITKKSGLYGWGDNSQHEVHVFDATGTEVEGFNAPLVEKDGKTYTELRIGEDWSAAIARMGADRR